MKQLAACLFALASIAPLCSAGAAEIATGDTKWEFGVYAGFGLFNFRDSLFADVEPDPPGNLSEDWNEFFLKPWMRLSAPLGAGELFGEASLAYARTGDNAADVSGGTADSLDFDNLYLGWRHGAADTGLYEVAGGRYTYQIANGFILSDGYADGGSRGAIWSNPRKAWAPGLFASYAHLAHRAEIYYLDRDERPESDSETTIAGINYEWQPSGLDLTLGVSYLAIDANQLAPQRDGASVWNLRLYARPFRAPLDIEAEWVYQDNGQALDATAWYIQPYWGWEDIAWPTTLYYRYAYFEGDDPVTPANEQYDPLFPAFHDWGSWWQGEIAGEYFISNSNLISNMLRLHTQPLDKLSTGLIYFDFKLDQPGSYQGGVTSDDLANELDWYLDWKFSRCFSLSLILARASPGRAVEEAFGRTKDFKYGMVYVNFSY